MNNLRLPIQDLVEARSSELGISRSELASRCGFKNVNKGLRRIDQLLRGDLDSPSTQMILTALPLALNVDREIVTFTVRKSVDLIEREKRRIADEQGVKLRASFKPNAWLLGTESKPRSIVIYGVTGGADRWLRIPLDASRPPLTYAAQAFAIARKYPKVPFHGDLTGFVVNYRSDRAVVFSVAGDPVDLLFEAYTPAQVHVQIGNRKSSTLFLTRSGVDA